MRSAPLYDAQALRDLVRGAEHPETANWSILGRVVTVELALELADATL
jgi:hypothetical protein